MERESDSALRDTRIGNFKWIYGFVVCDNRNFRLVAFALHHRGMCGKCKAALSFGALHRWYEHPGAQ